MLYRVYTDSTGRAGSLSGWRTLFVVPVRRTSTSILFDPITLKRATVQNPKIDDIIKITEQERVIEFLMKATIRCVKLKHEGRRWPKDIMISLCVLAIANKLNPSGIIEELGLELPQTEVRKARLASLNVPGGQS